MKKSVLLGLSLLGLFDATYLTWVYASPSSPMVCYGGGCDTVRASRYAHVFGVPVPVYGVVTYLVFALIFFFGPLLVSPRLRRLAGIFALTLASTAFLFSAYLTSLEAFVIHAWCEWCLVSALTATAIFFLLLTDLGELRAPPAHEPSAALRQMQHHLRLLGLAIVVAVPAFWLLVKHGESAPSIAPNAQALEAHLIRPDTHFFGNPDAAVTVVEFGDFECPVCGRTESAVRRARDKFGGEVRFAFRQFPLRLIHPYAEAAAEASECAARQGAFWQAVDTLYDHQDDLTVPSLERYAVSMGLDSSQFDQCLTSGAMAARVAQDKADGKALGVRGTPTFFFDGKMVVGFLTFKQISALINQQLAEVKAKASKGLAGSSAAAPPSSMAVNLPSSPTGSGGGSGANFVSSLQGPGQACSDAEAKMKQPTIIHTAEARRWFVQKPQALFVDVRSQSQFRTGHIPKAINLPASNFESNFSRLPKNRVIVLYQGGHSSGDICAASRAAGRILLTRNYPFANVKVYQGGLAAWQKAGMTVAR